ncbi:hypothetical protein CPC08DRAFT_423699 [Agrocybe pediades]|nr:hypothetical protein CPC08DRAFT_423699 [Agrocybe pediades]
MPHCGRFLAIGDYIPGGDVYVPRLVFTAKESEDLPRKLNAFMGCEELFRAISGWRNFQSTLQNLYPGELETYLFLQHSSLCLRQSYSNDSRALNTLRDLSENKEGIVISSLFCNLHPQVAAGLRSLFSCVVFQMPFSVSNTVNGT